LHTELKLTYPHDVQATEAKYRTAKAELDELVSQMEGL
jgi:exonuclease VII small subunit